MRKFTTCSSSRRRASGSLISRRTQIRACSSRTSRALLWRAFQRSRGQWTLEQTIGKLRPRTWMQIRPGRIVCSPFILKLGSKSMMRKELKLVNWIWSISPVPSVPLRLELKAKLSRKVLKSICPWPLSVTLFRHWSMENRSIFLIVIPSWRVSSKTLSVVIRRL